MEYVIFGPGLPAVKPDKMVHGGKGAGLLEMSATGYPVPYGMIIPTNQCFNEYPYARAEEYATSAYNFLTNILQPKLGFIPLVSVRSGAPASMPGMMDSILNVGLNEANLGFWEDRIGLQGAYNSFCRLIEAIAVTVHGVEKSAFEELDGFKYQDYLAVYKKKVKKAFPQDVVEQLALCILAVWRSWKSERAREYRKLNNIPENWGTAVTIQQMVFGNANEQSATGVLFTRNTQTGAKEFMGEFLVNAQGEDVVSGAVTPKKFAEMAQWNSAAQEELMGLAFQLEEQFRDVQDIEFTIENGKLYLLQTRNAKRSAYAAFKIAHDMVEEGMISKAAALKRVTVSQYKVFSVPKIAEDFKVAPDLIGIPASNGLVVGKAVFSSEEAKKSKEPVILIRKETNPEDFPGMAASVGILTSHGGATSHAAVVARGMDKPCVVGALKLTVSENGAVVGDKKIQPGDKVTMNGATGEVWFGIDVPVMEAQVPEFAEKLIRWGAEEKNLMVRIDPNLKNLKADIPEMGKVVMNFANIQNRFRMADVMKLMMPNRHLSGMITAVADGFFMRGKDEEFLKFLGGKPANKIPEEVIENFTKMLENNLWQKKFKNRWSVQMPEGATQAQRERVAAAGWKVVRQISNLAELMKAEGYVEIMPTLTKTLDSNGTSVSEMFNLLLKAGQKVESLPRVVRKSEVLFEVLS